MIYAQILQEVQVNPAERAFWEYIAAHYDPYSDIDARLRADGLRIKGVNHQRVTRFRAAVLTLILAALRGETDRAQAAIDVTREVLKLFFAQKKWESQLDLHGHDAPKFFDVACDIAAEIEKSGINLDDARRAVEFVLCSRRVGLPAGLFEFYPEKAPVQECEDEADVEPVQRRGIDPSKIDSYANPRLLTPTWQSAEEKDWPAILPELKHIASNFDIVNGLQGGATLEWYDPLADKGGIGPISLIAHVLGISEDDAARRLVRFIAVFADLDIHVFFFDEGQSDA
jgi:hypothetical protein